MKREKLLLFILLIAIFVWQTACGTGEDSPSSEDKSAIEKVWGNLNKAEFPPPLAADFEKEKLEAENLIESGITFKNTLSMHGVPTERGVKFGTNEFESSDGVKIKRHAELFDSPEAVRQKFESATKDAAKIFEKDSLKSGEQRFVGAKGETAEIVYTSGYYLYRVSSPSLRHLLAFELKEAHFFDYK